MSLQYYKSEVEWVVPFYGSCSISMPLHFNNIPFLCLSAEACLGESEIIGYSHELLQGHLMAGNSAWTALFGGMALPTNVTLGNCIPSVSCVVKWKCVMAWMWNSSDGWVF